MQDAAAAERSARLRELAWLFLKLGTTAFGGPAVHVATMEEEVVRRRGWLSSEQFLDLLGATALIPGPSSTELAIHIGRLRAGTPGLLVAGLCFIVPATALVCAIAWAYVRFGALPQVEHLLYGVKPVVLAVVVHALVGLARSALRTRFLAGLAAIAFAASLAGVHELAILAAAALLAPARHAASRALCVPPLALALAGAPALPLGASAASTASIGLWPIFLFFLKVGSVLFGSGYVLLAFLRADLVERLGWLDEAQLLDAIAVGQVTPGPVFTTATFIGWLLGGPAAALVATAGIFLPAFAFVAASAPLIPRLRASPWASAALDGLTAPPLALMSAVALLLARTALIDLPSLALGLVAGVLLVRWRVSSAWLVAGGGGAGLLLAGLP